MNPALETAIANLYTTFAQYPLRADIEACPCCVSSENQNKLSAKALRALESEDISHYAWKAMTTWGQVADFKHFLPRLLELIATSGIEYETGVVLRKLTYAEWRHWPMTEQEVVRIFALAWWSETINEGCMDAILLIELYELLGEIGPLLKCWIIDFGNHSFRNLVDFIQTDYYYLTAHKLGYKKLDSMARHQLLDWLQAQKDKLEQGFFHFESIDPHFAQEISNALYQLDTVK